MQQARTEAVAEGGDRRRSDRSCSRWVCFDLAGQTYGLPILQVQEVLATAAIEPVPGTEPLVLGVINLRGNVVTVIDLRQRLNLPPRDARGPTPIIVVSYGNEPVGLQVDQIADVRKIADSAIKPAPAAGAAASEVQGMFSRNGHMLTLLDARAVVEHARMVPPGAGAKSLTVAAHDAG